MENYEDNRPNVSDAPEPAANNYLECLLVTGGILIVVGGIIFSMSDALVVVREGATRSVRLQWEERQAQIQEAIKQAEPPLCVQNPQRK